MVRDLTVALALEHQGEHSSQRACIESVAAKSGMTPETLRRWVRQAETDGGFAPARQLQGVKYVMNHRADWNDRWSLEDDLSPAEWLKRDTDEARGIAGRSNVRAGCPQWRW